MGMLDDQDLQRIGVEMGKVLEYNIMPQLDMIHEDIKGIKGEICEMKADIVEIKAVMVTKEYLDDKLADLRGDLISYDRGLERKTDAALRLLVERRALAQADVEDLESVRVFPQRAN